jgi:hypothetical protein
MKGRQIQRLKRAATLHNRCYATLRCAGGHKRIHNNVLQQKGGIYDIMSVHRERGAGRSSPVVISGVYQCRGWIVVNPFATP